MGYVNINGERIHIDNSLVPIIKTLNEKGYETDGCCEGHWHPYFPQRENPYQYGATYIGFKDKLPPLDYIYSRLSEVGIEKVITSHKDIRVNDTDYMLIRPEINCIRFYLDKNPSSKWHKSRQRTKIFKLLLEWAQSLPNR